MNGNNIDKLYKIAEHCCLCPRNCGVNRLKGEKGACRTSSEIKVASVNLHYGEEPPVSGDSGSGTIFFSNCSMSCVFCQNYPISQLGNGNIISVNKLSEKMLFLQKSGANNINLVTPTHLYPFIAEAVYIAKNNGLKIPVLSNCSGYENVEVLKLMEDFIDIYMPDMKYSSDDNALKYSGVKNYTQYNMAAVKEMHRQKGTLSFNSKGIAVKGILIRHLVLPNRIAGSDRIFHFISDEISQDTYVSVMAQYHTANRSGGIEELNRKITQDEYNEAVDSFYEAGLHNGWVQEL